MMVDERLTEEVHVNEMGKSRVEYSILQGGAVAYDTVDDMKRSGRRRERDGITHHRIHYDAAQLPVGCVGLAGCPAESEGL